MALDLMSEDGLLGELPRRYRHEAESFAWCLIYLCLSMVEDTDGKIYTRDPHPLYKWFRSWKTSHNAKFALQWREHDNPGVPLVHPNTKPLAQALRSYWVDRYRKQLWGGWREPSCEMPEAVVELVRMLNVEVLEPIEIPPYEELEDEHQFRKLVAIQVRWSRGVTKEVVRGMAKAYLGLD